MLHFKCSGSLELVAERILLLEKCNAGPLNRPVTEM